MPLLSGVAVLAGSFLMEKHYSSQARILLNLKDKKLSLIDQGVQQYEIDTHFDNLFQLLKSRSVVDKVRQRVLTDWFLAQHEFLEFSEEQEQLSKDLDHFKNYNSNLYEQGLLYDSRNVYDATVLSLFEENGLAYEHIIENLNVYRMETSNYIAITLTAEDPDKSTYLLELLLDELVINNQAIAKAKYIAKREQTEELVQKAKVDLAIKEKKFENFKINNNIINLDEYTRTIVNQVVDMEVRLIHLKEAITSKRNALSKLEDMLEQEKLVAPVNDQALNNNFRILALKDSLKQVGEQLFFLTIQAESNEAEKYALQQQADQLRRQISEELLQQKGLDDESLVAMTSEKPMDGLQERYITFQLDLELEESMVPLVQNELKRIKGYAKDFAPLEFSMYSLERDVKVAQEKYLQLLSKLETAVLAEKEAGVKDIIIIDTPLPPDKPEEAKRILMVIGAFVATLILLAGTVVSIEIYRFYNADIRALLRS
ncbi:hypothetical protein GCM10023331_26970 [Algivirga pacifica]|uniref:Tyrosine-protein kinase G-rich domain-containing protein n=2 Tax=Algivirga pacifica TaxID=1162670 RepID=A0ABP9DIZ8_9BACT